MAIISTYPIDASVNLVDKLIGTDVEDSSKTKNYTVDSILQLLASVSVTLLIYADNTAAVSGGLVAGQLYRNAGVAGSSSVVCVVY
jgi:hypothetical protein|tara:strand:+ start:17 stop:274 length:258 start_codon:yes stop_codon:yes gene_type:complete